ncbi:hypothetical protein C8R46DRAFT_523239 [Mycena filopes]|nr:hypothetical protein C8R46DRAFT_523239 [Mycena filopes]
MSPFFHLRPSVSRANLSGSFFMYLVFPAMYRTGVQVRPLLPFWDDVDHSISVALQRLRRSDTAHRKPFSNPLRAHCHNIQVAHSCCVLDERILSEIPRWSGRTEPLSPAKTMTFHRSLGTQRQSYRFRPPPTMSTSPIAVLGLHATSSSSTAPLYVTHRLPKRWLASLLDRGTDACEGDKSQRVSRSSSLEHLPAVQAL